jgi:regulator of RNase E activity RraB
MWFAILLLSGISSVAEQKIDPDRLASELAADADVIASLRRNGDEPTIVRAVDVRFVGTESNVKKLLAAAPDMGWRFIQTVGQEDGTVAIDLQRNQSTETSALTALTKDALQIEAAFEVRYDGWGTLATSKQ